MRPFLLSVLILVVMNLHAQLPVLNSGLYAWDKLTVKKSEDREARQLMEGSTSHFDYLEIHATTQYKGAKPRRPHAQKDLEELILVTEGTMKFIMDGKEAILSKGSAIIIPPLAMQALENIGNDLLTYYVLMFRSIKPMDMDRSKSSGGALFLNADELVFKPNMKGGRIDYLNRATAMCENLELHVTQLNEQGPSHDAHKHLDSEMILVIEGEVDVMIEGQSHHGKAGDLFLIKSNEMHGIQNSQNKLCKYFALRWR